MRDGQHDPGADAKVPNDPDDPDGPDGAGRSETATERADRNWNELLQELRVAQTGVQILTGFLLTVPFQQRFTDLEPWLRGVLLVALALATLTTALIVSPVASHRLLFRRHAKAELVSAADRVTKIGLVTLALTIVAVVVLVFGFVGGVGWALVAGVLAMTLFVVQWLLVPRALLAHRGPRPRR